MRKVIKKKTIKKSFRRPKERDTREWDTTQLREATFKDAYHRDYSAHFFRWAFAKRFVNSTTTVLDIGCGIDLPLFKILTKGTAGQLVKQYTGVDLNKLPVSKNKKATFLGEFNFVKNRKRLLKEDNVDGFDIVTHFEVIEHMREDLGELFLSACYEVTKPGGLMLMSTPCYDGVRHAANHIHEYTIEELQEKAEATGFIVEARYGTFMDIKHITKNEPQKKELQDSIIEIYEALKDYYSNDTLSCMFAPLFPDHSRNNFWVCRKPL